MSEPETSARYLGHYYLEANPSWDSEDSPWKAALVAAALERQEIKPGSIVDVGCGAGAVLAALRERYPASDLFGFEIAPDAGRFWAAHAGRDIRFSLGDFLSVN